MTVPIYLDGEYNRDCSPEEEVEFFKALETADQIVVVKAAKEKAIYDLLPADIKVIDDTLSEAVSIKP